MQAEDSDPIPRFQQSPCTCTRHRSALYFTRSISDLIKYSRTNWLTHARWKNELESELWSVSNWTHWTLQTSRGGMQFFVCIRAEALTDTKTKSLAVKLKPTREPSSQAKQMDTDGLWIELIEILDGLLMCLCMCWSRAFQCNGLNDRVRYRTIWARDGGI